MDDSTGPEICQARKLRRVQRQRVERENQETHHRRMDFPTELLALLKKHGVTYDPEHVLG
jgi:hypothetical protein